MIDAQKFSNARDEKQDKIRAPEMIYPLVADIFNSLTRFFIYPTTTLLLAILDDADVLILRYNHQSFLSKRS